MTENLVFGGYLPKRIVSPPDWLAPLGVREIGSAGHCLAPPPDDWISHWTHNDLWLYDTPAQARAIVPPDEQGAFRLYAYRLFPALFEQGRRTPWPIPALHVESPGPTFRPIGFDVVSRSAGTTFECSPLSCNYEAQSIRVNPFCLIPALQIAIDAAVEFSLDEPEPGPYVVVEVLVEGGGGW
jgi:hypothetical protein